MVTRGAADCFQNYLQSWFQASSIFFITVTKISFEETAAVGSIFVSNVKNIPGDLHENLKLSVQFQMLELSRIFQLASC